MDPKLILFLISIIQFSVCYPFSSESLSCSYKNDENLDPYISVNCKNTDFNSSICDNLKQNVNISSVSAVSFENCEIIQYSDILNQFPNISKLLLLKDNILPSVNFSSFEHLSLFQNIDSIFNTNAASAKELTMNATDLELFYFNGEYTRDVTSISLHNATQLEHFFLQHTFVSKLPDDLFLNSNNLTIIYGQFNQFENIDSMNWPNSVRLLDFSWNKIHKLGKSSFENLTNLQILELDHNQISEIEAETFTQLNKTISFDLSSNHIKKMNKTTLKGLDNLIYADFTGNKIDYIEDGAFKSTPKLVVLSLPRNNISSLNSQTFAGLNNSLLALGLDKNPIRELTADSLKNLSQLRHLQMNHGKLNTIDFNAFASTPKLGQLDLSYNNISRLVKMAPTAWNNNNQTTNNTFFDEITKIINELDIKWLKPVLTKAGLLGRKIIQDHFRGLKLDEWAMKEFMIHHIMGVYSALAKGSNYGLKQIDLSGNQLTEIEKNIFDESKSLTQLVLTENPITTLYPESFAGLNELESLHLDGGKLTSVDFAMFTHLTKLKKLYLSGNQLTAIIAAPLPSIVELELNENQLTDFPMKKVDLPNLKIVSIGDNPLTCSKLNDSFAPFCQNQSFIIENIKI